MEDRVIAIDVDDHFIEMCGKLGGEVAQDSEKHFYLPQAGEVVTNPIGVQLIAFCETDFKEIMMLPLKILGMKGALQANTSEAESVREKYGLKKSSPYIMSITSCWISVSIWISTKKNWRG